MLSLLVVRLPSIDQFHETPPFVGLKLIDIQMLFYKIKNYAKFELWGPSEENLYVKKFLWEVS